jgi:hypothetical protein
VGRKTVNSSTYFNLKGGFSINFQATCDFNYMSIFASAICPGSTHDSTAFPVSSLSRLLNLRDKITLLPRLWIAGDEAYVYGGRNFTLWPERSLLQEKNCFIFWLSSARIQIEQAFGILYGRRGIFRRPLRTNFDNTAPSYHSTYE